MKIEKTSDVIAKQFYTQVKKELKIQFPNDKFSNIEDSLGFGQLKYRTDNLFFNEWKNICTFQKGYSYHDSREDNMKYPILRDEIRIWSYEKKYSDVVKKIAEKFKVDMLFERFNGYEESRDRDWFYPVFAFCILLIMIGIIILLYSVS